MKNESDWYEDKRIAQNEVKVRLEKAKAELKEASSKKPWVYQIITRLQEKVYKLEDEWLQAGDTGD